MFLEYAIKRAKFSFSLKEWASPELHISQIYVDDALLFGHLFGGF